MDTKTLIAEAKARFNHNSAKAYLKDKYEGKFIVADQSGLWKADIETINFLNGSTSEWVILIDTFKNPVRVNRSALLEKLSDTYNTVMEQWYTEWSDLEKKR
jgi:hypothetical protein